MAQALLFLLPPGQPAGWALASSGNDGQMDSFKRVSDRERQTHREVLSIHSFSPQMSRAARARPSQNRDPGTPSRVPTWVAGAQDLGASSAACPAASVGSCCYSDVACWCPRWQFDPACYNTSPVDADTALCTEEQEIKAQGSVTTLVRLPPLHGLHLGPSAHPCPQLASATPLASHGLAECG